MRAFTPILTAVLTSALLALSLPAPAAAQEEPPFLAERVELGQLPPLAERLPAQPRSDLPERDDWESGRYGGRLNLLTRGGRDARDLVVLGYARLMVWTEDFQLVPDLLLDVEVEENRRFTLKLRPGHRWSDGQPFTAEGLPLLVGASGQQHRALAGRPAVRTAG